MIHKRESYVAKVPIYKYISSTLPTQHEDNLLKSNIYETWCSFAYSLLSTIISTMSCLTKQFELNVITRKMNFLLHKIEIFTLIVVLQWIFVSEKYPFPLHCYTHPCSKVE